MATVVQGSSTTSFPAGSWLGDAPSISIAWERTDLARWALPTTTTIGSIQTQTISSVQTQPASSTRTGLSTSAMVGIGIGAAAGGLAVAALLLVLGRRHRRKQGQSTEVNRGYEKAELPGDIGDKSSTGQKKVLHVEADDIGAILELESGWTGWEAPVSTEPDTENLRVDAGDVDREHSANLDEVSQQRVRSKDDS